MSRIYTQDEVREIIRRAADVTAERERQESENSGLTMGDLRDLAASTGIDPDVMADAARSLDRDVDEPFERRILGLKISAAHAIRVEGPFTDEDWQALVSDCRTTFEAKGKVHDQAGLREWSNGNLHVLVEPAGEDVIIRMRTHNGQAQSMAGGSVAIALAMLAMVLSAYAEGPATSDLFGKIMILFGALFATSAFVYTRIRRWSQTREAQMEAIGRRIEQRRDTWTNQIEEREPDSLNSHSGERLELSDEETDEMETRVRARRRDR